jgi:DNA-directed RNA polymerase subunit A'
MKLTVPEIVQPWNMEYLKKFVQKGPKEYPGANYIVRPDGRRKKITDEMKEQLLEELQPGYYVERHLLDGDVAIFNRQPSLHRMSMMCHCVKVLPNKTFRLNPAVCVPYNADFDGDEMNLHIPQTEEARAEAEILMQVHTQLLSPRYGLSIIGCVQDAISGNYMLTKYMKMSREDAVELLLSARILDVGRLPKKEEITGKEIFSVLLPADFHFQGKTRTYTGDEKKDKANDAVVVIKNGKLLSGVMDKANLGEGSGLMLKNLHQQYGAEQTLEILGKMFRLGIESLLKFGFSTVISDTDLPEESKKKIRDILDLAYTGVDELIDTYRQGKLDAFPGRTVEETLELRILEKLNIARNETGSIVSQNADLGSHTAIMTLCGSRGNALNLAQMAACVGQQAMRGKRIQKGYRGRTLSCFQRGDLSPSARGFIRSSFKSGMSPAEFFFGAMTGRDSLMDTALRTPKSGYLYRRLANALQDMRVAYDGSVRDANGMIVQFKYGEDGIDVSKSEKGKLNVQRLLAKVE